MITVPGAESYVFAPILREYARGARARSTCVDDKRHAARRALGVTLREIFVLIEYVYEVRERDGDD